MDDVSLKVGLGTIRSEFAELIFSLSIKNRGDTVLEVFAHSPADRRKAGVLVQLREDQIRELNAVVEYATSVLRRIHKTEATDEPKLQIASNGEDFGHLSVSTIKYLLENEVLTLQDFYFDTRTNDWLQLDLCPDLVGKF